MAKAKHNCLILCISNHTHFVHPATPTLLQESLLPHYLTLNRFEKQSRYHVTFPSCHTPSMSHEFPSCHTPIMPHPSMSHTLSYHPSNIQLQEIVLKMEESYPRRLGSLLRCGKPPPSHFYHPNLYPHLIHEPLTLHPHSFLCL